METSTFAFKPAGGYLTQLTFLVPPPQLFLASTSAKSLMSVTKHLCPFDGCLDTFGRTMDVKAHMNLHLGCQCVNVSLSVPKSYSQRCSWYQCPFCRRGYVRQMNAIAHVATCPSRVADMPDTLHERFDARYPLLRVWSHTMGVPKFKDDGSKDAEMVVRDKQVLECAKGSRDVRIQAPSFNNEAPV